MRYDVWNLGSSSEGNCFIVKHKDCKEALMLECGLSYEQFKRRWVGAGNAPYPTTVLISHEHLDHCRGWEKFCNQGFNVYASVGTADALGDTEGNIKRLNLQKWQMVGVFRSCYAVFPLKSNHDAGEPLMYLIRCTHPLADDTLLFAIDTAGIPYILDEFKITDMLVECNYIEECISPDIDPIRMERTRKTHMSLDTLVKFFERGQINLKNLEQITLCHLSQSNCDPKKAKETIMAATGVPVHVCAAKGGFIG